MYTKSKDLFLQVLMYVMWTHNVKKLFNYLGLSFEENLFIPITNIQNVSTLLKLHSVRNLIVNIPDISNNELIFPAIVFSKSGLLYIIENRLNNQFLLFNIASQKRRYYDIQDYLDKFSTTILLLEHEDIKNYISSKKDQSYKLTTGNLVSYVVTTLLIITLFLAIRDINLIIDITLFCLNLFGLLVACSYFLAGYGSINIFINRICNPNAKENLCFKGNRQKGVVRLDILATTFFSFNTISILYTYILYSNFAPTVYYFIFSIISLAVAMASIILQKIILLIWCRICLIINTVILIHFVVLLLKNIDYINEWHINVVNILFSMIILLSIFLYDKILLLKNKTFSLIAKENAIWTQKHLLNKLLIDNHGLNLNGVPPKVVGKYKNSVIIHLLLNISCHFCEQAFQQMLELYKMNSRISLYIYVKYPVNDYNEKMMEKFVLTNDSTPKQVFIAFLDWKKNKVIHSKRIDKNYAKSRMEVNKHFFLMNNVSNFPTIIINGKLVPEFVDFKHLKAAFS